MDLKVGNFGHILRLVNKEIKSMLRSYLYPTIPTVP